jgi:hypothetical protein
VNWSLGSGASPQELLKLYENGFPGAPTNPIEYEKLFTDGIVLGPDAVEELLRTNPGNNKRACLYRSRELFDPGAYGQESQTTGDCTSHGDRSARDTTRSIEIHIKGEAEEYYKRGATEPTYGYRGHGGQGMDPARAARFVTEYGFLVRQNYEGVVDLTKYNSNTGARWGGSGPPQEVLDLCKKHAVGKYLVPETSDEAIALFQNGYACHSGQNVGFNSTPTSNGIHAKQGTWNHDMATVGYDDTREIWPVRVYFVANSWATWNQQWSKWLNDIEIQKLVGFPFDGMITVHGDVWEQYFLGGRSIYFYSDIDGFPAKTIPNYGTGSFL